MEFLFPVTQLDMDQVHAGTPENLSVLKLVRIKKAIAHRVELIEADDTPKSSGGHEFQWQRLALLKPQVECLQAEIDHRDPGHQLLHKSRHLST